MRKLSRLEANKEARRVLTKNGVNLSYAQYSVSGREIRLTGWLCHHDSSNFTAHEIELIVQECMRVLPGFMIAGDFENWKFSSEHITQLDTGSRNPTNSNPNADEDAERYVIDLDYDIG